ncbi:SMC5-SMC6 complex localization factor protein 2 isoform X2 [Stegostoma tigrinum]|uniref:SMC5-SMC6 complex localization factor protein 2 isoform X2 n=1 Tax=Stegostoma tigrinum TaxID=3053191 RepID=UPI0028704F0C|nr:SMC5-SMC6 complex localization factor protein 2 isoform X2 [Stegostoma tigrinum]
MCDQVITQFFKSDPDRGKDRLILGSPRRGGADGTSVLQNAEPSCNHKKSSFKSKRSIRLPSSPQRSPVLEAFMKGVLKSDKRENMGGVVKCQVTQHPGSPRVIVRRLFLPSSPCPSEGAVVLDQGKNVEQPPDSEVTSETQRLSSKCDTSEYRTTALRQSSLPNQRIVPPPDSRDVLNKSNLRKRSESTPCNMKPRLSLRRLRQQHSSATDFQSSLQAYKKARELRKLKGMQKGNHSSDSPFSADTVNQATLKRTYSVPSTSLTGNDSLSKQKESVLKLITKTLPSGSLSLEKSVCSKEAVQRHHSFPPCPGRKSQMNALKRSFTASLPVSHSKEKRKRNSSPDIKKKKIVSLSQHLDATFHKKSCENRTTDKYSSAVTETSCNGVLKDHNNGVLENEDLPLEADEFPDSHGCLPLDSLLDEEIPRHKPPSSYVKLPAEEKVKIALDSAISSKENRSGLLGKHCLVPFDGKRTQRHESNSLIVLPLDEKNRSLSSQDKKQLEWSSAVCISDTSKGSERKLRDSYNSMDSGDDEHCNLDSDEDENLVALDDLLTLRNKPVSSTPEKLDISLQSSAANTPTGLFTFKNNKQANYSNTFDRLLKEKQQSEGLGEALKDLKKKLQEELTEVPDLHCLSEEDEEQVTDEDMDQIAEEHRAFLIRFSVKSDGIPDVHPGEKIFNVLHAGKHFHQHNLRLTQSELTPQNFLERTLISSGSSQQVFLFTNGIISQTYQSSPCPQSVLKFLFKMMSIHSDYIASMHIFKTLWDICTSAANRVVKGNRSKFKVWTPSLKDIVAVFLNLGAQFGTLFPLKHLQPDFTEEDILSGLQNNKENYPEDSAPASQRDPIFGFLPEFGIKNVIKFLQFCTSICPEAYSDQELALLISLLGRISLERELQLTPLKDFQCLLDRLLNNIRQWNIKMSELCMILSDLSEHHHNLLYLVQQLPDFSTRGRQLRRHLSMVIISKLLDKNCLYVPKDPDLKIASLCRFLYMMKPSSLLKTIEEIAKSNWQGDRKEATLTELDQQAYYLCYNLLVLANEVLHIEHIPPSERGHLIQLCAEIEKHIKCDIREDPKLLYRSKVKDLEARTHAKWQELLQRSRPLQGKLHDYWEPMSEDQNQLSQSSALEEELEHYRVQEVNDIDKDLDIA